MNTKGIHIVADFWGVPNDIIYDQSLLWNSLKEAANIANMTIMNECYVPFSPQGFTGILVLAESHLSIHTYPEEGFIAVDAYTCGSCQPSDAIDYLIDKWNPGTVTTQEISRGIRLL